jgi:lipoprotein-anchoring transpeptidase ErfK/SrfK
VSAVTGVKGRRVAVVLMLMAFAVGCTVGGDEEGDGLGFGGKPRSARQAIRVMPEDGAKGVGERTRIEVALPGGRLERVEVTKVEDARETEVPGRISADGLHWHPRSGGPLALAATYTVDAVALDGHGRRHARRTTFATQVPEHRFIGYVVPEHRSTVGAGMIVSIEFSRPIENRAAVERAIGVTAEPAVPIEGHWFGDDRLDFRPERYWKPGTEVTVDLGLRDLKAAPGVYGIQRKQVRFTIGRSQLSLVDAAAHTMAVRRDGRLLTTLPITAGAPKTTTYNGKMVVTELLDVTRMNGQTVGFGGEYDIPDVPHAMRLTTSGTFLHGNYWAPYGTFGEMNVSHGCVGLRDVKGGGQETPAGWFFDRSLVGDVVEVVNSRERTVAPDNGLGGWNMSWQDWRAGSALP